MLRAPAPSPDLTSFLDVILILLALILAKSPQYGVKTMSLPVLSVPASDSTTVQGSTVQRILLRLDGAFEWKGESMTAAALAARLRRETSEGEKVPLDIETLEPGQGAVDSLLEFQKEASRQRISDRILLPYRRQKEPMPLPN
jgi:biopolymer transport protein ExbD